MCVCGGTSGPKVELNLPRLFFKQLDIIGASCGSQEEFREVTRLMGEGLPAVIDDVVALADYDAALARLRDGAPARQDSSSSTPGRFGRWTRAAADPALRPQQVAAAKEQVLAEVDQLAPTLIEVSHSIWDRPELCFEEHHAHDLLCDVLESEGVSVTRGAHGLPTAFRADEGERGPVIAVCCEYDALPDIGHACGHNVIAAAGLGAGLAAATVAGELGGRLRILGTPAEEGGGGKASCSVTGRFDGVDAAMMVHPADQGPPHPDHPRRSTGSRSATRGAASHAAAAPAARPQRARCGGARIRQRRSAATAHPDRRAGPRHLHRGRRAPQHRPPACRGELVRPGGRHRRPRAAQGPRAHRPAGRRGRRRLHHDPSLGRPAVPRARRRRRPAVGLPRRTPRRWAGRSRIPTSWVASRAARTWATSATRCRRSIRWSPSRPRACRSTPPSSPDHARSEAGDRAVLHGARAMAATIVDRWAASASVAAGR